jgi:hypothetical protein
MQEEDVMKETFKLLGIIVLAVVIGFCFFACDSDGDDDDDGTNTKKEDVKFPDSCSPLMPQGDQDRPEGNWLIGKDEGYLIFDSGGKFLGGMVKIGDGTYAGTEIYDLESVSADGKTIKVIYTEIISATEVKQKPMTVCTGWTVTGKNLVITGGTDDFAALNGKTLTLASGDEAEGGDPLVAKWYQEEACTNLAFELQADGKIKLSGVSLYNWVVEGEDTIKTTFTGMTGTIKYVLEGKKLTLSEATAQCSLSDGTFYKE